MIKLFSTIGFASLLFLACSTNNTNMSNNATNNASSPEDTTKIVKVVKTEAEWKKILSDDEYAVLRESGTERAFGGKYWDNHEKGTYYCKACDLPLFSSQTKFESGTGWPSFYQPINENNVFVKSDKSYGMSRDEVECARCNSHLGHLFDDGPEPTGLRYCINSICLLFKK